MPYRRGSLAVDTVPEVKVEEPDVDKPSAKVFVLVALRIR